MMSVLGPILGWCLTEGQHQNNEIKTKQYIIKVKVINISADPFGVTRRVVWFFVPLSPPVVLPSVKFKKIMFQKKLPNSGLYTVSNPQDNDLFPRR